MDISEEYTSHDTSHIVEKAKILISRNGLYIGREMINYLHKSTNIEN